MINLIFAIVVIGVLLAIILGTVGDEIRTLVRTIIDRNQPNPEHELSRYRTEYLKQLSERSRP